MVHLISKLRKAAEDRFGSGFAVTGTKNVGPLSNKAAVPEGHRNRLHLANFVEKLVALGACGC
jgi:hypothetical protein